MITSESALSNDVLQNVLHSNYTHDITIQHILLSPLPGHTVHFSPSSKLSSSSSNSISSCTMLSFSTVATVVIETKKAIIDFSNISHYRFTYFTLKLKLNAYLKFNPSF